MIIYTNENLFLSPAQTLVNTVNTVGVMGKGIAKDFKKYYPTMFKKYKYLCSNHKFSVGQLMLSKEEPVFYRKKPTGQFRKRWVLNFPTKKHWRNKSQLEYIELGLQRFVDIYKEKNIESISFPQLGVGNGGLKWSDVKKLMEKYLNKVDIPVYIHLYSPSKNSNEAKQIEENLNTEHDVWENNIFLAHKNILKENYINCDGIVLPGSIMYKKKTMNWDNIKKFSIIVNSKPQDVVWLQKDTKEKIDEKVKVQTQLNLFDTDDKS